MAAKKTTPTKKNNAKKKLRTYSTFGKVRAAREGGALARGTFATTTISADSDFWDERVLIGTEGGGTVFDGKMRDVLATLFERAGFKLSFDKALAPIGAPVTPAPAPTP